MARGTLDSVGAVLAGWTLRACWFLRLAMSPRSARRAAGAICRAGLASGTEEADADGAELAWLAWKALAVASIGLRAWPARGARQPVRAKLVLAADFAERGEVFE